MLGNTAVHRRLFFSLFMTASMLLLTACGWHLRGSITFPAAMETVYVQGTAEYSELGVAIRSAFAGTNSTLVSSPAQARAILHIISDQSDQRLLFTNSSTGISEYEISYVLRFKLIDAKGAVLVSEQQIKAKREYKFDSSRVLATVSEVGRLKKDMVRIGVQQMLYRINASLRDRELNPAADMQLDNTTKTGSDHQ